MQAHTAAAAAAAAAAAQSHALVNDNHTAVTSNGTSGMLFCSVTGGVATSGDNMLR